MNKNKISIVILAAGKGSRMKSSKAKVLHPICGKEMLYYIIKTSRAISDDVSVVVAHQRDAVVESMSRYFNDINFVTQDAINFPGTGGAMKGVNIKNERVLVLNGDMPLVEKSSLDGFLEAQGDVVMSIFNLQNPSGYGRVIIEDAEVKKIVEQKDATLQELKVQSVNAGIYAFSKKIIEKYIPLLQNNNAQEEYYLTDIISMARNDGIKITPLLVNENEYKGVNSKKTYLMLKLLCKIKLKTL